MSRKYRLKEKYRRKLSHFLLCQMKIMIAISLTVIGMNSFLTNVHAQNETYGIYKADGKIYACDEGALDSSISNEIDIRNVTYLYIHRDVTKIGKLNKNSSYYTNVYKIDFLGTQIETIDWLAFSNLRNLQGTLDFSSQTQLTTISGFAFTQTKITSIILPASVNYIDNGAFSGCNKLKNVTINDGNATYYTQDDVLFKKGNGNDKETLYYYPQAKTNESYTIPDYVKIIGVNAFQNVSALKNITIPTTVTDIKEGAFSHSSVENVSFNSGSLLRNIDNYVFKESALNNIVLPERLITIGESAFDSTQLETINIPQSVINIGVNAFYNCLNMTTINVAEGNQNYKSDDGVFYTKDGKTLINYPISKSIGTYTVIDGVRTIEKNAFIYAKNISYVVLPETVNRINYGAFYGSEIKGILFEGTLPTFESNVFLGANTDLKLYTLNSNEANTNDGLELYKAPVLNLENSYEGEPGDSYQIDTTFNDDATFKNDISYALTSSNPAIASITPTGLIKMHQPGTTNITVTVTDLFKQIDTIITVTVKGETTNEEVQPNYPNDNTTPVQSVTKPQENQKESNSNKDKNQPVQTNDQTMLIEMIGMLLLSGIGILSLRRKEG